MTRSASSVLSAQKEKTGSRMSELERLREQAFEVRGAIERGDFETVGGLLEASWQIKRTLVEGITGDNLDALHKRILSCGASGAKLLGAGGGGFFLAHGESRVRKALRQELEGNHRILPLVLDRQGSVIIHDDGKRWG